MATTEDRLPAECFEDHTFTPDEARRLLLNVLESSRYGVVEYVANHYADLMKKDKWKAATIANGGAKHPILLGKSGEVIYGVQRLMACIHADKPFDAVLARIPPNHQGYY